MLRRILLLCGVLSPLLYAVADILAGLRWEGYSFRDQAISELGAIGAPSRSRFGALLLPTYLLLTAFGVGVWSGMEAPRIEAGLPTPWVGVRERIFWYAYQLWFLVLPVTLLREQSGAGHVD